MDAVSLVNRSVHATSRRNVFLVVWHCFQEIIYWSLASCRNCQGLTWDGLAAFAVGENVTRVALIALEENLSWKWTESALFRIFIFRPPFFLFFVPFVSLLPLLLFDISFSSPFHLRTTMKNIALFQCFRFPYYKYFQRVPNDSRILKWNILLSSVITENVRSLLHNMKQRANSDCPNNISHLSWGLICSLFPGYPLLKNIRCFIPARCHCFQPSPPSYRLSRDFMPVL